MPRETELCQMTCDDLRELAKMLDIPKRWSMKKAELVEAILQAENAKSSKTKESAKEEYEAVNQENNVEVATKEKQTTDVKSDDVKSDIDYEQKLRYVENAKIGTLIAFKLPDGKVKSAKITNKSTKNKKLRVETEYGAVYIVPYDNVLWVRTGLRWPKGVYRLLKGLGDKDGKQK